MNPRKVAKRSLLPALLAFTPLLAHAGSTLPPAQSVMPHLGYALYAPAGTSGHFVKTDWDDDGACPPANIDYLSSRLDSIASHLNWRISHEVNEGDLGWGQARYLRGQVWRLSREGHHALADGCITPGERASSTITCIGLRARSPTWRAKTPPLITPGKRPPARPSNGRD